MRFVSVKNSAILLSFVVVGAASIGVIISTNAIRAGDATDRKPIPASSKQEVLPSATVRFAKADANEVPDMQRHVLPLMGRLGCNGRSCHGSFQGAGGFRLSLFGYDFDADHKAMTEGDSPRINLETPAASAIITKPLLERPHKGGKRFEPGSWEHHLFLQWAKGGAKGTPTHLDLKRLEVTPRELSFKKDGEHAQLKVLAHWANGLVEDVTCLCRFQSNDESIATVNASGYVVSKGTGDTHVVAFYDNGVEPVSVIRPVTDQYGPNYPKQIASTKVDEIILSKLSKLGVIPSEVCSDTEFLRRVSLDVAGRLPSPTEIRSFAASQDPEKRAKKIEELLLTADHAAWWATKLSDYTGNNPKYFNGGVENNQLVKLRRSREWYEWLNERLKANVPYDQIVEGMVLAVGREPGQTYEDYCRDMSCYYSTTPTKDFTKRNTMPHFWSRTNLAKPEDKALNFSYAFLGVRLQCAQCHKHPFDQWTQQDFTQFQAFFNRISFGVAPDAKSKADKMFEELGQKKLMQKEFQTKINEKLAAGEMLPYREVFLAPARKQPQPRKGQKQKVVTATRAFTPKLLGGEEVMEEKFSDPREALMDWLRDEDNPYFARAIVNRVWSHYFGKGIIEPVDDQNLANPPKNEALLDYLSKEFIAHKFDLRWLHRTILTSDAYQRSWRPNDTNQLDENFSRGNIRRLPAEVAYDAITLATASDTERTELSNDIGLRAISQTLSRSRNTNKPDPKKPSQPDERKNFNSFALNAFGKPVRETTCDCERSDDPTLLQSLFLRNDAETLQLIDRKTGWVQQVVGPIMVQQQVAARNSANKNQPVTVAQVQARIKELEDRIKKQGPRLSAEDRDRLTARYKQLKQQLAQMKANAAAASAESSTAKVTLTTDQLVEEAYLRTLSRYPSEQERARVKQHLAQAENLSVGMRDLVWALLNCKEFVLNH